MQTIEVREAAMLNVMAASKHLLCVCLVVGVPFIARPTRADLAPDCNGLNIDGRPSWANELQIQVPGCPDPVDRDEYNLSYIGHDEPSVVFYSDKPHSASNLQWEFVLPSSVFPK